MNQQTLINKFERQGYVPALSSTAAEIMLREYAPGKHCGQIIFNTGECATLQTQDIQRVLHNEEIDMTKYTRSDILGMPEKERTELYNKATGKNVARMRNKEKAADEILAAQKTAPIKVSQKNTDAGPIKKEDKVNLKTTPKAGVPREGSVSETIWLIAEEMSEASRAEVVAACVEQGINEATAKTQYQRWRNHANN